MKTLFLLLLSAVACSAQTVKVQQLWQAPAHEFHGTNGCPTNWPVARVAANDTNTVCVSMTVAEYTDLTNSLWPSFQAWHTNQWAKFAKDSEPMKRLAAEKSGAKETFDSSEQLGRLYRAMAQVLLNEINNLRTNQVPALPARTPAQVRTAIRNELDAQP